MKINLYWPGTNKGLPLNFLRSVKAGCDKSSCAVSTKGPCGVVQNKTDFAARAVLNALGISGARSDAGGGMSMGRREGFVRIIAMVSKLGSFENFA